MRIETPSGRQIGIGKIIMMMLLAVAALIAIFGSWFIVPTGNVGVKTTFGQTSLTESNAGVGFKLPLVTSVQEFNFRETAIDFKDLTPKAGDNLSLKDLDVTVFYTVNPSQVADVHLKFLGQSTYDKENGVYLPGHGFVFRMARESIYDAVAQLDSLTIHKNRDAMVTSIQDRLQRSLDASAPGAFNVEQIAIRAVTTDPAIEESIRAETKAKKDYDRKVVELEIAKKDAEIALTRANGEAEANRAVTATITPSLLKQQYNEALMEMAKRGANTVVMDGQSGALVNIK